MSENKLPLNCVKRASLGDIFRIIDEFMELTTSGVPYKISSQYIYMESNELIDSTFINLFLLTFLGMLSLQKISNN